MKQILIVEDDKNLNNGIRLALRYDYLCVQAFSIQSAREEFANRQVDLILLDVNLPDGNGMDFLAEIRKMSQVPVIMLTVNKMEMDIVSGLESGANDYITKPFSLMVLRARVGVQLRGTGDAELGAGFSGGVSGEIIPSGNWHYSCKCAEAEHSPHTEGNTETVYGESGPKKCGLQ